MGSERSSPQQAIKVMKELLHNLDSDGDFTDAELQEIRRLATEIDNTTVKRGKND